MKQCTACGGSISYSAKRCRHCGDGTPILHVLGYIRVYSPGHPLAGKDGYVLEHRLVLYNAGISVPRGWHIHHLNGDKTDNRLDNLAVVTPKGHRYIHTLEHPYQENQHGVFPILVDEAARLERQRARGRENQRRIRARRKAERDAA